MYLQCVPVQRNKSTININRCYLLPRVALNRISLLRFWRSYVWKKLLLCLLTMFSTDLNTSPNGLTSEEAKLRLKKYGQNKLQEKRQIPLIHKFIRHLRDLFGILLLVAAGLSIAILLKILLLD